MQSFPIEFGFIKWLGITTSDVALELLALVGGLLTATIWGPVTLFSRLLKKA